MSETAVYDILDRIQKLPAEDRVLLDELLADQEEAEWSREAVQARRIAREKQIDQEAIDRAVHAVRHNG